MGCSKLLSYSARIAKTGLSRCCEERAAGSVTNNAPGNTGTIHVNLFRTTDDVSSLCEMLVQAVALFEAPKRSEADVLYTYILTTDDKRLSCDHRAAAHREPAVRSSQSPEYLFGTLTL